MESTFRVVKEQAFVITEDAVKKIWGKLQSFDKSVTAVVEFSDSIERKINNLEDLLQFENSNKKLIKRIEFIATCQERKNITRIELESDSYRTVTISSSGDDEIVNKVVSQIPEIIDGLKPWYSSVAKTSLYLVGFTALIILCLFVYLMSPETEVKTKEALSFAQSFKALLIFTVITFICISVVEYSNKLKKKLFPIAFFALGQGVGRYEFLEKIRWGVIVSLIVSLVSSVIFGFLPLNT